MAVTAHRESKDPEGEVLRHQSKAPPKVTDPPSLKAKPESQITWGGSPQSRSTPNPEQVQDPHRPRQIPAKVTRPHHLRLIQIPQEPGKNLFKG